MFIHLHVQYVKEAKFKTDWRGVHVYLILSFKTSWSDNLGLAYQPILNVNFIKLDFFDSKLNWITYMKTAMQMEKLQSHLHAVFFLRLKRFFVVFIFIPHCQKVIGFVKPIENNSQLRKFL